MDITFHALQRRMESTGDNIILLLLGELDEVYCIARYPDGELRVVLGMSLSIKESLPVEYVYVEVVTALNGITVEKSHEIIYLLCICCHSYLLLYILYPKSIVLILYSDPAFSAGSVKAVYCLSLSLVLGIFAQEGQRASTSRSPTNTPVSLPSASGMMEKVLEIPSCALENWSLETEDREAEAP